MRDLLCKFFIVCLLLIAPTTFAQNDDTPMTPSMCMFGAMQACISECDARETDRRRAECLTLCSIGSAINCGVGAHPLAPHSTPLTVLTLTNATTGEQAECTAESLSSADGVADALVTFCGEFEISPPDCGDSTGFGPAC